METLCFSWTDATSTSRSVTDLELNSLNYSVSGAGQEIAVPFNVPYYIPLGYNNRVVEVSFTATSAQNTILSYLYTETNIEIDASVTEDEFPELPDGTKWTVSNISSQAVPGSCGLREYTLQLTYRGDL